MKWFRPFDPPETDVSLVRRDRDLVGSSPFKGEVRRGMVFWRGGAKNHPHPNPPLEGEGTSGSVESTESAAALLQRMEWTTLKRLDGLLQGDYRTLLRGVGLDLADLREYQLHDDVRHIDWNVTARMQTPYVRQFSEDRDMNAWFLVDLSPSANFSSGARSKRTLSIEFVALMSRLITQHGNRAGLIRYTTNVDTVITPRADRVHVLHLLHRLMQQPLRDALRTNAPTQLHLLLARAASTMKRRSAVFVVSDFISEPGWEAELPRLAQRHDVVVVRMSDPLEMNLPNIGLMTLEDPETGEQLFVDTTDPALRKRFAALHEARQAAQDKAFSQAGVTVMNLRTDQSLVDGVAAFIAERTRRSQSARAPLAPSSELESMRQVA